MLTFHTTFGRQFTVGKFRGGKSFTLTKSKKVISHFVVGFGRYMHKIGAFFSKPPKRLPRANRYQQPVYNINQSILSSQSDNSAFERGIVVNRYDNVMPSVTIPNNPNNFYGGASQRHQVPERESESLMIRTDQLEPVMRREVKAVKTNAGGIQYQNTKSFDDYQELVKGHSSAELTQLRVLHDGYCIYGVQSIYTIDGREASSEPHCNRPLPAGVKNEVVMLSSEETILSIEGSYTDIVNSLKIRTSSGKVYRFGRIENHAITQEHAFNIAIPGGRKCVAIAGGYNSYLHNLACYYY